MLRRGSPDHYHFPQTYCLLYHQTLYLYSIRWENCSLQVRCTQRQQVLVLLLRFFMLLCSSEVLLWHSLAWFFCWVFDTFLIYWIYVFISFTRSGGFWHPTFKYSVTFTSSFPSASAQYDHLTLYYSHSPSSLSSFIPVHFLYSIIWVLFYLLLSLLWSSTYYLLAFIWRLSDP